MEISVVIPVYKAESFLEELLARLRKSLSEVVGTDYEICLVDDRSPDKSWAKICQLKSDYPELKAIRLSKNRGQHKAIMAGLNMAKGKWVVVMDCDLQDAPEEIPNLWKEASVKNVSIVLARRAERMDSSTKQFFSKVYFRILNYLADAKLDPSVGNFGIYEQKVIAAILRMKEQSPIFPLMVNWVGFSSCYLDVKHAARASGKSSYTFRKRVNLAVDAMLSYSSKPLRFFVKLGVFLSFSSFCFALYNLVMALLGKITVSGYASLIVSIWFLSGLLLMGLGITGLYIGKVYDGVKDRPLYLVDEELEKRE